MLHCSKNLPIMLTNAPIMLKLCLLNVTLTAKTNHLDCFKYVCLGGAYFHNFSMFADIGPLPSRFDSKTLVALIAEFPLRNY